MKLKKKICKKCWGNEWHEADDVMWRQGEVHCRCIIFQLELTKIININEVPDECRYKLEQLLLK